MFFERPIFFVSVGVGTGRCRLLSDTEGASKAQVLSWVLEDMFSTPCRGSSMMVLPLQGVMYGFPCSSGRCPGLAACWSFRPPTSPRWGRHNTGRGATPAQREWIKQNPEGVTECVPLTVCRPFRALVCRLHERGLHPRLWSFSPSDFLSQAAGNHIVA